MRERLVLARGAWVPVHRATIDCWCRPHLCEQGGGLVNIHNDIRGKADQRERAFISGRIQAPI